MESFLREGVDLQGMSGRTIAGDAHFFEDATTPAKVRAYLDSAKELEKLKGMKWLLAMLSKGRDVSEYFPDVVKNVVVKSVEVKKTVYIYLVHYADYDNSCREIALLSINSFQKDMSGTNQLIRGLALRVMTSIRVPDIIQIQLLAVRKCATDSSPYVRKCAATALPKIFALDPEQLSNLKQILDKLLKDSSTMVLGSAVAAFNEVCPSSYDILHKNYRKLCHLLADMDEWTQISVLEVMTRYIRNQFTDPAPGVAAAARLQAKQRSTSAVKGRMGSTIKRRIVKKAFYSDEEDESDEEDVEVGTKADSGSVFVGVEGDSEGDLDPDHRLALRSSLPLLKSRNSGVVLGVCALHHYCGSQSTATTQQVAKALVRILRNRREIQYVVLTSISAMAQQRPAMFRPFLSDFLINSTDPVFNRLLKLEILTFVCSKENTEEILRELQIHIKHSNEEFVCATVRAVGRVADAEPLVADRCMEGLMHLMACNKGSAVVGESVVVLRQMLQQSSGSETSSLVLHQLAKLLVGEPAVEEALARSSIVWLVGEFHEVLSKVAPDILRILAVGFTTEATETKMQIMNLAIKLSLRLPDDNNVQSLMTYILEMARYDLDTDLRDRSRFMTALMGLAPSNESEGSGEVAPVDEEALEELAEHAAGIMLAPKLPPVTLLGTVDVEGLPNFNLGSLSSLVGHYIAGYQPLCGWPDVQPNPTARDAIRLTADEDENRGILSDDRVKMKGGKNRKQATSSSSDSDDDSDRGSARRQDLSGFYGEKSDAESSSDSSGSSSGSSASGSEESSDESSEEGEAEVDGSDESDSSAESASEQESDLESDSDSEEEEEAVTRIPLTQAKTPAGAGAARQGMRKVASTQRTGAKGRFDNPVDLSNMILPSYTDSSTSLGSQFGSMSMNSTLPPGAGAAISVANDFGDDFSSLFPTSITMEPVGLDAVKSPTPDFTNLMGGQRSNSSSIMDSFDDSRNTDQHKSPQNLSQSQMPHMNSSSQQQQQQQLNMMGGGGHPNLSGMQQQGTMQNNLMFSGNVPNQGQGMAQGMGSNQNQGMGMGMNMGMQQMGNYANSNSMGGGMNVQYNNQINGQNQTQGQGQMMNHGGRAPASPVAVPEDLSDPKVILKADMGGGLAVSLVFRYGAQAVAYMGAHCAYLVVQNVRDHPIRRVKISFPSDVRRTQTEDIAVLAPGQQVAMPFELVVAGLGGKQLRVDVRSDVGAFVGTLTPECWEVLFPITMSANDFATQKKRMGGFGMASRSFPLSSILGPSEGRGAVGTEIELVQKVKKMLNVFSVQGAGVGELLFAGCSRKGVLEEKVLVTVTSDSEQATFTFNSEDALLTTALLEAFRKAFSK